MPSVHCVNIICRDAALPEVLRAASLALSLGLQSQIIEIGQFSELPKVIQSRTKSKRATFIVHLANIAIASDVNEQSFILANILRQLPASILFIVSKISSGATEIVRSLSQGTIRELVEDKQSSRQMSFAESCQGAPTELAGRTFPRFAQDSLIMLPANGATSGQVMSVGQWPSFVTFRTGKSQVFIWSTTDLFDMHRRLATEEEFEKSADQYLPLHIFFRSFSGEAIWRNPRQFASFVIDDPLIQRRYGRIDFERLVAAAVKYKVHVTIGFIPWNYWRTTFTNAQWFARHRKVLGICAHGCDHLNREFLSNNGNTLARLCWTAHNRLEILKRRTGLDWQRIMVCPQEKYSTAALRVFSECRCFQALSNTSCLIDRDNEFSVRGIDLLLPAMDVYFGFPIIKRCYENEHEKYPLFAYLGKPAVIVGHHESFENPEGVLGRVTYDLKSIRADIQWTALDEIAKNMCLERVNCDGVREIRFFTDEFVYDAPTAHSFHNVLVRRVGSVAKVSRVCVNGSPVRFQSTDGWLRFELGSETRHFKVQVHFCALRKRRIYTFGPIHHFNVGARRILSEFRDNVLSRNRVALGVGKRVARFMRQTGD